MGMLSGDWKRQKFKVKINKKIIQNLTRYSLISDRCWAFLVSIYNKNYYCKQYLLSACAVSGTVLSIYMNKFVRSS